LLVSFSSIEHDGLGRYGDPINPNGYLAALHEMRSWLSPGGYLLLGIPVGPEDKVVFNAHRIFGPKSLQHMVDLFEVEAVVWNGSCSKELPWYDPSNTSWFEFQYQPVFVLRKPC
jgi:hypothetical protein